MKIYRAGRDETTELVRTSTVVSIDEPPQSWTEPISREAIKELARALVPAIPATVPPEVVRRDAERQRYQLLTSMGNECAALALDTAANVKPESALETLLIDQLALAHKAAMESASRASLTSEPADQIRFMNQSARMMEVFQRGTLTLQRLRTGGSQKIVVHHVNVADGGQAIVGNLRGGDKE